MPTTVILGTGIIGLSTAYYLSLLSESNVQDDDNSGSPAFSSCSSSEQTTPTLKNPNGTPTTSNTTRHEIHLVEPSAELFASASGKAAGFLAKDWFAQAVAPLGAFSFDLHRKLAEEHGGREKWGFSESASYSLDREDSEDEDEYDDGMDAEGSWDDEDESQEGEDGLHPRTGDATGNSGTPSSNSLSQSHTTHTERSTSPRRSGSRTRSTDLEWLMNGSSRMTLLDEPLEPPTNGSHTGDKDSEEVDDLPRWLRAKRSALQAISDRATTGQVDPYRLCQFLLQQCMKRGVKLHHPARATQLVRSDPDDPSSQTFIRLEYTNSNRSKDLDPIANQTTTNTEKPRASPNSLSPPSDEEITVNGLNLGLEANKEKKNNAASNSNGSDPGAGSASMAKGASLRLPEGQQEHQPANARGTWESLVTPMRSPQDTRRQQSASYSYSSGSGSGSRPSGTFTNGSAGMQEDYLTARAASGHYPSLSSTSTSTVVGDANGAPPAEVRDIACDSIVISAGCWTPRVYRTLFPNASRIPRVTALAGHSVVLKSKRWPGPDSDASQQEAKDLSDDEAEDNNFERRMNGHGKVLSESSNLSSDASTTRVASPLSSTSSHTKTKSKSTTSSLSAVCHAVFTSDPAGYSPEIFSRLSGDIWLGGLNSSTLPLPTLASDAIPIPSSIQTLLDTARALLASPSPPSISISASNSTTTAKPHTNPGDAELEVLRTGLCFRPVAPTGRPVIARMHEADLGDGVKVKGGVFVATGHGPWGISLSLGTGYVVGEMVLGREGSVDVGVLGTWEAQAP